MSSQTLHSRVPTGRETHLFLRIPSTEVLGYHRASLRDENHAASCMEQRGAMPGERTGAGRGRVEGGGDAEMFFYVEASVLRCSFHGGASVACEWATMPTDVIHRWRGLRSHTSYIRDLDPPYE